MSLIDYEVLTFDCYGTLIDWETGLLGALAPLMQLAEPAVSVKGALEVFALAESTQESETPDMRYPQVLEEVHSRLAMEWGVAASQAMSEAFGQSVPSWPAFADSVEALGYLKRFYRLVILSNVDRESFRASNSKLAVEFDAVYTAEDIGSYKPDPKNFEFLLRRLNGDLGIESHRVLHVAQSVFHDHVPASKLGIDTCWIDRRSGKEGWGATAMPDEVPDLTFHYPDMATLVRAHREALR